MYVMNKATAALLVLVPLFIFLLTLGPQIISTGYAVAKSSQEGGEGTGHATAMPISTITGSAVAEKPKEKSEG